MNSKKTRTKRRILPVLGFLLLILLSVIVIQNRTFLSVDAIKRAIVYRNLGQEELAREIAFDSGGNSVFVCLDGGLVAATNRGIAYYGADGARVLSELFAMKSPVVMETNGRVLAYDTGGSALRALDSRSIYCSLEMEAAILSAQINRNGWLAVCTEANAAKGLVTVFNGGGQAVYEWFANRGYLVTAAVSPNNTHMSALILTGEGARVVSYSLDNDDEAESDCLLEGLFCFALYYTSDATLCAVSDEGIYFIEGGAVTASHAFEGASLSALDVSGNTVLCLKGAASDTLLLLGASGNELARKEMEARVVALSLRGKYLGVLLTDSLMVYKGNLELCAETEEIGDAQDVLMREDGTAFLIEATRAVLFVP